MEGFEVVDIAHALLSFLVEVRVAIAALRIGRP